MDYISRFESIETRANALNMTLHETCRKAGVRFNCVWRWRNGDVSPKVVTVERDLSRLERYLDGVEGNLQRVLAERRGAPAAV